MARRRGPLLGALEPMSLKKVSAGTDVGIEIVEQALPEGSVPVVFPASDNPETPTYVSVPILLVTGQEDLPHR